MQLLEYPVLKDLRLDGVVKISTVPQSGSVSQHSP
jgi:hypothetical protein